MTTMDRNAGLGASEAAAALGLDPYTSPTEVWMAKTGQGNDVEATLAMRLGRLLEDPVARLYAAETGHRVQRHRRACRACTKIGMDWACRDSAVFDGQFPWLYAHLDRVGWDPTHATPRYVLEIKTTGWPGEEWGESGTDQVPLRVLVQVVLQMRLANYARARVAALLWGRELRWYEFERTPETERQVLDELRYFWHLVESGSPPVHADHKQTGRALRRLYAQDSGLRVVAGEDDWALVDQVLTAYATWKSAEAAYEVAMVTAQARLGDLAGLEWDGGSITWKTQKAAPNWKNVAQWVGTLAVDKGVLTRDEWDQFVADNTGTSRVFRVHVKRGAQIE
jgi:putative phage-type endonuclease